MNIHQITWVKTPITSWSAIQKFISCMCMLHSLTSFVINFSEPLFQDFQMLTNWWNNWITIICTWAKVLSGWQAHFSTIHHVIRAVPCGGVRGAIVCHCKVGYYFIPSNTCTIKICDMVSWRVLCSLSTILFCGWQPLVQILPTFKSLQVSVNSSDKNWLPL